MEYFYYLLNLLATFILVSISAVGLDLKVETNSPPLVMSTSTAFVKSVIDGDTIEVVIEGQSDPVRVRYIGIDTPEPYREGTPQCGSKAATKRNTELVANKNVNLIYGVHQYDSYGRLLAYVYVEDKFVNQTLLTEGYAKVMMIEPNTEYQKQFKVIYQEARQQKRGIWSECK